MVEDKNKSKNKKGINVNEAEEYSLLVKRMALANVLGSQYGGQRNVYEALGYPVDIKYFDYLQRYLRQDIARAIINRPVSMTWKGEVGIYSPSQITESKQSEELWTQWKILYKRLALKNKFVDADKLASLGRFSILLLGFNDVRKNTDWRLPVMKSGRKLDLLYVTALGEDSVTISEFDNRISSERHGLPLYYSISFQSGDIYIQLQVHYSRVIHIVTDTLGNEVYGTPTLEPVYNRLMDLEKLVGSSAEMYWRGAYPGYAGVVDKDYHIDADTKKNFQAQVEEYEHNLRRILISEGIKLESLAQQIASPKEAIDIQIQMISAITGIPQRILTGSERGELASSSDRDNWFDYIETRRKEFAEPRILVPFVNYLMQLGILPLQEDWVVDWESLYVSDIKKQVEVGKTRAEALKLYVDNPVAANYIPPEVFFRSFLGLSEGEIDELDKLYEEINASLSNKGLEEEGD